MAASSFLGLCAQNSAPAEECGAEIKLLLVPAESQAAVKAFHAAPPAAGHIYLYDTQTLELSSRGVILRIRQGAKNDLMVKVRVPANQALTLDAEGKCELDRSGGTTVRSYSVLSHISGPLPASGNDLMKLLSPAQKRLLQKTRVAPDWNRVQQVVDVTSMVWRIKEDGTKLTLEQWQWRGGNLLELSTKTAGDADATESQLKQTVAGKGLSLSATQEQKTALALRSTRH